MLQAPLALPSPCIKLLALHRDVYMLCARSPPKGDPTPADFTLLCLVWQIDASDGWPRYHLEMLAQWQGPAINVRNVQRTSVAGQSKWALSATQSATHGRVCAARTQGQVWVHFERTNAATLVRTESPEGPTAMAVTDSALYLLHAKGTLDVYALDTLTQPPVRLQHSVTAGEQIAVMLRALPGGSVGSYIRCLTGMHVARVDRAGQTFALDYFTPLSTQPYRRLTCVTPDGLVVTVDANFLLHVLSFNSNATQVCQTNYQDFRDLEVRLGLCASVQMCVPMYLFVFACCDLAY